MIRTSVVLLFLFLSFSYAQEVNLDSLYSKFVAHRSNHTISGPDGIKPTQHEKCGFGIASQVRLNFTRFNSTQQAVLKKLADRPDLNAEYVSPFGHFKIHYDISGVNKPDYEPGKTVQQNVETIAAVLDSVYKVEIEILGYPAPPSDENDGGDNLYDIYITNQSWPEYGYTQPETNVSPDTYTSWISIDNDFLNYYSKGISGAKVTLAHEFHHAIQLGNYALRSTTNGENEDLFFFEMTSTAMEEFVYDYINDYYAYLRDYFNSPEKNFQRYRGYELVVWNIFLKERFGIDIIKKQWELFSNDRAFPSINNTIAGAGSSFKRELNLFGIWSYYTGYRKEIAVENSFDESFGFFEEGEHYPLIKIDQTMNYAPNLFPVQLTTLPMSNNYIKIVNTSASPYADTIVTIITNGNFSALINTPNSFFDVNFSLFDEELEGTKHMVNDYYYEVDADNPDNFTDANIFNNRVVNGGEFKLVETDYAYPVPFYYKESRSEKIFVPVAYNPIGEARLYIYTADMNLVYEGIGKIIAPNDKFVLEWNARDAENNKLSSGVYLYVTKSEDTIKKGKIIIFSE